MTGLLILKSFKSYYFELLGCTGKELELVVIKNKWFLYLPMDLKQLKLTVEKFNLSLGLFVVYKKNIIATMDSFKLNVSSNLEQVLTLSNKMLVNFITLLKNQLIILMQCLKTIKNKNEN